MNESVPHVLIIEDEKEIRRFVRMALQAEGLEVHEADTFHRGLIDAGTRRPDLIVLDLGLPDGDGIDLIRDVVSPGVQREDFVGLGTPGRQHNDGHG